MELRLHLRPPRRTPPSLVLGLALAAAVAACDQEEVSCKGKLFTAVQGTITDSSGHAVDPDRVTVVASLDGAAPQPCQLGYWADVTDPPLEYDCVEQGAGRYEVTVEVDGKGHTRAAEVEEGECRIAEAAELDFVLDFPECAHAGQCEVYDDACCSCGPLTLNTALARRSGEEPGEDNCQGIACGACPEIAPAPPSVVPACVEGTCEAVDIHAQPYAACAVDDDCTLIPASCCGWCGAATPGDSFAIRGDSVDDYRVCDREVSCATDCPDEAPLAEAYCHQDGYCDVRAL